MADEALKFTGWIISVHQHIWWNVLLTYWHNIWKKSPKGCSQHSWRSPVVYRQHIWKTDSKGCAQHVWRRSPECFQHIRKKRRS